MFFNLFFKGVGAFMFNNAPGPFPCLKQKVNHNNNNYDDNLLLKTCGIETQRSNPCWGNATRNYSCEQENVNKIHIFPSTYIQGLHHWALKQNVVSSWTIWLQGWSLHSLNTPGDQLEYTWRGWNQNGVPHFGSHCSDKAWYGNTFTWKCINCFSVYRVTQSSLQLRLSAKCTIKYN